jgi:NDP-sugar pyrophosphorylase family protein
MKAAILAGGMGVRLRPITYAIPKPLLPIGRKPLLELIISQLVKYNFRDIILFIGYKGDLIKAYFQDGKNFGVNIHYIQEERRLGTAGPLGLAKGLFNEPFVMVYGDILAKINFAELMEYHLRGGQDLTVVLKQHEVEVPFGVFEVDGSEIKKVREKPKYTFLISAGEFVIDPKILDFIEEGKPLDMPQLIEILIQNGKKVANYYLEDYWMDIGEISSFEQATEEVEKFFDLE